LGTETMSPNSLERAPFVVTRRAALAGAGSLAFAGASDGFAQGRDVTRFLVGASAGGPVEAYARVIALHMEKTLGTTIITEVRPGANGSVAAQVTADAPADGKTIWIGTQSMIEINPLVYPDLRWKASDFTVLMKGLEGPIGLVANPTVPAKTLAETIDWVKKNPGKLSISSYSPGTPGHFLGVQLNEKFGLDLAHVPYRGSAPQVTDLMAGQVLLGFTQLPSVLGQIQAGSIRAIATTGSKRFAALPDVPTFSELGYPDFLATVWYGIMVRSATPDAVKSKIVKAAKLAHADPQVRAALKAQGLDIVAETGPAMEASVRQGSERWARIVKATGFRATD
jgi:tripartite-type tricarboxylate transporter receptor subunit TctC